MLAMLSVVLPVLVSAMECVVLVVFNACGAKLSAEEDKTNIGAMPAPFSSVLLHTVPLGLVTVNTLVRLPGAVGANCTLIEQFAPGASVAGQLCVARKSPLTAMLPMLSATVPLLVNVTFCAALVLPTAWSGKCVMPSRGGAVGLTFTPKYQRADMPVVSDCNEPV